jgi:hypothetical protein
MALRTSDLPWKLCSPGVTQLKRASIVAAPRLGTRSSWSVWEMTRLHTRSCLAVSELCAQFLGPVVHHRKKIEGFSHAVYPVLE